MFTTATGTVKAFAGTVDSDAERLKSAIALYRVMDAENAEELMLQNSNMLDFLSTHLTRTKGDKHAGDQADQIAKLRGLVADIRNGNVVVGGDFNAEAGGDSPSAQEIRNFDLDGFDTKAGTIHDGPGGQPKGTSEQHYPIDHVLPRGVGSTPAERWDRGESDHDGQRVDVTMPAW
ncbi:endonuclease/exonuclease/phosphatase family protein [Nocardia sp. XZ_19_385]|uniref:endonuclease/exonuclease/phosphatase family protein n=1 Tax=Nocardia sp. XZ_19_385 TaxID=2769488 RepID=UPI00188E1B72|nr:endonuclease/exonuclease/phosphatase family protein [Nocardia sp. XZ_19_385]